MAYHELIKNFDSVREYIRSFYVYGFRRREEYSEKSARSYDNERRRVESWLGQYMSFGQDAQGRRVFLSVNSRAIPENPLYRAFRAKSFTDRDIMLHFHLMDMLMAPEGLSITEVMDELSDRVLDFELDGVPDESTVRKKLREYAALGLIQAQKRGRETVYRLSEDHVHLDVWQDALGFFTEAAPLGVVGAYLQDKLPAPSRFFRFKHHDLHCALDSEVLLTVFTALSEKRLLCFRMGDHTTRCLPLKVFIGTQSGRQYLLGWMPRSEKYTFFRIDRMDDALAGETLAAPVSLPERTEAFLSHTWGVTSGSPDQLTHISMTLKIGENDGHVLRRLNREKRCGTVEQVDETHWRFTADVYSTMELMPWLRTFLGRITDLQCSDSWTMKRFFYDFGELRRMYGGDGHAVP